jgi:hypothetical protein
MSPQGGGGVDAQQKKGSNRFLAHRDEGRTRLYARHFSSFVILYFSPLGNNTNSTELQGCRERQVAGA